jgi:hypothetical protein
VAKIKSSFYEEMEEEESSLKLETKGLEMLMGCLRYRIDQVKKMLMRHS